MRLKIRVRSEGVMKIRGNNKYRAYIDEAGEDLKTTLQGGLKFIGCDRYINRRTRVFVKPNFTFPYYKEGVTTSPELLRCLLEILRSKAGTVVLGESDGGNRSFKAEEAFKGHNMYQICKETGVELVNLSTLRSEVIESRILNKKVKVQLPKMLLEEIDCFISVPVLKVHTMTGVSLSLKNSWGCHPDSMRVIEHQHLAHKLALMAKLLKPKMVIVDGIYALNKHGPMCGEPVKMNLVLMADNPVMADVLGAMVMGFPPQKIEHIAVAEKVGIGSLTLETTEINKDWKQYKRQFRVEKTLIDRLTSLPFNNHLAAKLVFDSPLTPPIYKVASLLRSSEEKEIARQIGKQRRLGPY